MEAAAELMDTSYQRYRRQMYRAMANLPLDRAILRLHGAYSCIPLTLQPNSARFRLPTMAYDSTHCLLRA